MAGKSNQQLLDRIQELESKLEEAEQLIDAIKSGEVDAFAINNDGESEIFTLRSGDYAYRILIEEFGEGAINVTEEGLIVYTNTYFFNLLGLTYEEVIGISIYDLIEDSHKELFDKLFNEALSGKSKGEIKLAIQDRIIPVYISLTSLKPHLETIGIIISDLSDIKKGERMMLEYQQNLVNKNMELIKRNAELASFTYIASHDLQEPLRKIQMFATRIIDKEESNLTETGKDHFNRMQLAARRMQTLIEDLLTYSRTNTLERNFERTDLNKLIAELKAELKEDLISKNAKLEVDNLCELNIIPFQFSQLLLNLISNALKFSIPGVPPHIIIKGEIAKGVKWKLKNLDPDKKYCHLTVSDNGIGFDQQYSEKIFELFQRLHGKTQYSGTGIGLAIVKKIVENHHGLITAKSEPGQGATFDIYIPAG